MTVPAATASRSPAADDGESDFFNSSAAVGPTAGTDEDESSPYRFSEEPSAPARPAPKSTFRSASKKPRVAIPPVEATDSAPARSRPKPVDDFDVPEETAGAASSAEEDDFSSLTSDDLSDGETMLEDTPKAPKKKKKKGSKKKARAVEATGWRQNAYWFLLLALIPLCLNSLMEGAPVDDRIAETISENKLGEKLEFEEDADFNLAQQVAMQTPDHRINGALLAADSRVHWVFAGLSAAVYLGVLMALWPRSESTPAQLIVTGLITGTIGIMLLLVFQYIAFWTAGVMVRGRSVLVLLFYLIKFIGFSYRCAIDPETGFGLSFMGFSCGVVLCEELCKAVPIAIYLNSHPKATWRDACLIGLASGVGFGVSEGITYSGSYYNGVQGSWIYLVRFISCVALHSLWAGAIGVLMYHNQDYISEFSWENIGMFIVLYLGIGMVLHGLYDTFLKSGLELGALITAGVSFGWFAYMVHRSGTAEA